MYYHWVTMITHILCLQVAILTTSRLVYASLEWIHTPESTAVNIGQNVLLHCQGQDSTNQGHISYRWLFNGNAIQFTGSSKVSVFQNNTLRIGGAQAGNLGNYTCHMELQGQSRQVTASIVPPYLEPIFIQPSSVTVNDSELVTFQCVTGYGAPAPSVTWKRDGFLYTGGTQTMVTFGIPRFDSGAQQTAILQFQATKDLEGRYSCVAKNTLTGSEFTSDSAILLVVLTSQAPYIERNLSSTIIVPAHTRFSMVCPIVAQPVPVIKWYKNGVLIDGTPLIVVLKNGTLHFWKLSPGDAGLYYCKGDNVHGNISTPTTTLIVASLGLMFAAQPSDLIATAGRPATLRCSPPPSIPPATIQWYKDYNPIVARSGEQALTVLPSGDLYFSNVQKRDEGRYFCVAVNQHSVPQSVTSNTSMLTVEGSPVIVELPSPQIITKEGLLQLKCLVSGVPLPTVMWYKDSKQLSASTKISFRNSNQELLISNTNKLDEGQYKCTVSNTYGSSTSPPVFIQVLVPPEIFQPISDITATERSRVLLTCGVYGDPVPQVVWYKDSLTIQSSTRVYQITQGLQILNIIAQDEGLYKCLATNTVGSQSSQGSLTVLVGPVFKDHPRDIVVNKSETVVIPCYVTGFPTPDLIWMYNGSSSLPDGVEISKNRSKLIIQYVDVHHEGRYTCVANNSVRSEERTGYITVQVPPLINNITGSHVVGLGNTLSLSCDVTGKPRPSVAWYHGNKVITLDTEGRITFPSFNNLSMKFLKKEDQGIYRCSASNAAGTDIREIQVYVLQPPRPPLITSIHPLSTTSVNITWLPANQDAMNDVTFYVIQYKIRTSLVYRQLTNNIGGSLTSYILAGLQPATEYFIRLAAGNTVGLGVPGSSYSVTTFETAPSEVRNLKILSTNSTAIHLSWEIPAVRNGDIAYYRVLFTHEHSDKRTVLIREPVFPTQDYWLGTLAPNTHYIINIQGATIEQGMTLWGNLSAGVLVKTKMASPTAAPRDLTGTSLDSRTVQLHWKEIPPSKQHGPIIGYLIKYKPINTSDITILNITQNVLAVNITSLLPWKSYEFSVIGYNPLGVGPPSDVIYVTTDPEVLASPPTHVTVETLSSTSILVKWSKLDTSIQYSRIDGYDIEVTNDNNTYHMRVNSSETTQVTVVMLRPWRQYSVRVRAYTTQVVPGQGPWSTDHNITTNEDLPGPVSDLKYTHIDPYSIQLSWKPPTLPNGVVLHYIITYQGTVIPSTTQSSTTISEAAVTSTTNNATFLNETLDTNNTAQERIRRSTTYLERNNSYLHGIVMVTNNEVTLTNLDASTVYNISVNAVNGAGTGENAAVIVVVTGPATEEPLVPQTTTVTTQTPPVTIVTSQIPSTEYGGLIDPKDLPFVIFGASVGGIIIIIILVVICLCVIRKRQTKKELGQSKYFIPPNQRKSYYDNSHNQQLTALHDRTKNSFPESPIDETDSDPYMLADQNTFHVHHSTDSSTRSDHFRRVKKKTTSRRLEPVFDSMTSQEGSSIGILNAAFDEENDLDRSANVSRDLTSQKKPTAFASEMASIPASKKSQRVNQNNDTDSLINNESVTSDERTAM